MSEETQQREFKLKPGHIGKLVGGFLIIVAIPLKLGLEFNSWIAVSTIGTAIMGGIGMISAFAAHEWQDEQPDLVVMITRIMAWLCLIGVITGIISFIIVFMRTATESLL